MKQSQRYSSLVWIRFRRNKLALMSLVLLTLLAITSIFAPFFSPNNPTQRFSEHIYDKPAQLHFVDAQGAFHFRPFIYRKTMELDPVTFLPIVEEDTSQKISLEFFQQGWQYQWLNMGLQYHLVGLSDGSPLFLLGSDNLGRDLLSRCFFGSRVTLNIAIAVVFLIN
jgi:peptide/nickel transport system permease protein